MDYKQCLKSGQRSYLHAELIKADPDGTLRVIVDTISEVLCAVAEDVVDLCPSGAIMLVVHLIDYDGYDFVMFALRLGSGQAPGSIQKPGSTPWIPAFAGRTFPRDTFPRVLHKG